MNAYYRQPAIYKDQVVFIAEDDLWTFNLKDKVARRLTANLGMIRYPQFSPDGKQIAFTSTEEGTSEVYIIPSEGGEVTRLTYLGAYLFTLGWKGNKIIFASSHTSALLGYYKLFEIDSEGGSPVELPYGRANDISFGEKGVVLGRNTGNPARWKRYRGGTAGYLLVDKNGDGKFKKLIDLKGNFAHPMWIGKRIYFVCDHEGIGNIYSCTPEGKDLQKHSNHKDFYARGAYSDGKSIIWHAGADLWLMDIKENKPRKLSFAYSSPMVQRQRKFVSPPKNLEDIYLSPDGGSLSFALRGKALVSGNWEGSVQQYGWHQGVRYRLPQILPDGKHLLLLSDEPGYERFEIHPLRKDFEKITEEVVIIDNPDLGRVTNYVPAPKGSLVAIENHRCELIILDLESKEFKNIDRNEFGFNR